MRLLWVGGPTTRIELGSFRIVTDPMFGEGPESFVMSRHPSTGEQGVPIPRLAPLPPVAIAVEGTRVAELIDPDTIIPIHHSTFPFYVEPIGELVRRLAASTYRGRLLVLREGESWTGA